MCAACWKLWIRGLDSRMFDTCFLKLAATPLPPSSWWVGHVLLLLAALLSSIVQHVARGGAAAGLTVAGRAPPPPGQLAGVRGSHWNWGIPTRSWRLQVIDMDKLTRKLRNPEADELEHDWENIKTKWIRDYFSHIQVLISFLSLMEVCLVQSFFFLAGKINLLWDRRNIYCGSLVQDKTLGYLGYLGPWLACWIPALSLPQWVGRAGGV